MGNLLEDYGTDDFSDDYIARAVGMVKGRIYFVKDLWDQAKFFFKAPETYNPKDVKKRWNEDTPRIMGELVEVLRGIDDFSSKAAEPVARLDCLEGLSSRQCDECVPPDSRRRV